MANYTAGYPHIFVRVKDDGNWGGWHEQAIAGASNTGFSGTKTIGTCVLTIANGLITNVTGC